MKRKTVAVFFGGRSGEHVVSLRSALSIMKAIDPEIYDQVPVGITREGLWLSGPDAWNSLWEKRKPEEAWPAAMVTNPERPGLLIQSDRSPYEWLFQQIDLAFPVLHGTYGEDGIIQGLFEMAGIPYVGSGVLASSTGMDKVVMKTLFVEHGLPVAPFIYFYRWQWMDNKRELVERSAREVGYPCFVKPANLGSSVGISKVSEASGFVRAVDEALLYDHKIIIEALVEGREIECSILGDLNPIASKLGEIIPCNDFYDYNAKYIDDRSELIVPVELSYTVEDQIKEFAIKSFQAIEASGLARVDFFLDSKTGEVTVNEINTMPGFTSISMYPKLWEASGVSYSELVNRLLELAEIRHRRRRELLFSPPE